jgi:flagellar protein FliO/FliZ
MMSKKCQYSLFLIVVIVFFGMFFIGQVHAADSNGEYLQYQEPKSASSSSWFSTISYVFSLLLTFTFVIGLAYFASRFVGKKMGNLSANTSSKIISTLPLGGSRFVYIVEIAGKLLVLGVTDQSITVLQEITDAIEIDKMKAEQIVAHSDQFDKVFQKQLASLQQLSRTFPIAFGASKQNEQKHEGEKR